MYRVRTVHIVIPAYNEAENVPRLMDDLVPRARAMGARVIVVDDGSSDETAELLRSYEDKLDLRVISHRVNSGLGAAVNTGLRAALADAHEDDPIVTLEADTTSDLDDLPAMLSLFERGYDLVLASVYAPGGRIVGVAAHRIAVSRAVSNVFRLAAGLRELHTLSSLYRVYRAGPLRRAASTHGDLLVRESGFAVNIELLLKLHAAGARVGEVPTVNDWSTRMGSSKMRFMPTAIAYVRVLAAHFLARVQPAPTASPVELSPES
jgi:dolichol-phosphate mannosyltransferase